MQKEGQVGNSARFSLKEIRRSITENVKTLHIDGRSRTYGYEYHVSRTVSECFDRRVRYPVYVCHYAAISVISLFYIYPPALSVFPEANTKVSESHPHRLIDIDQRV